MKNVKGNLKNTEFYKDTTCGCIVRAIWLPAVYFYILFYYKKECKSHINHPTRTYYSKSIVNRYFKKVYL